MVFAERLKSLTFELRKMEKEHYAKVQELHGGNGGEQVQFKDDLEMGKDKAANADGIMLQTTETVAD